MASIADYDSALARPPGRRKLSPALEALDHGEMILGPAFPRRPGTETGELCWAQGRHAAVYRCRTPDGKDRALRFFLGPPRWDTAVRYAAFADHRAAQPDLPFLTTAEYIPDAICLESGWRPAVIMDWVEGRTLDREVRRLVRLGDHTQLSRLADAWETLVQQLQAAGIAHGDLEPTNVIVTRNNELRLVDYDTVLVPALAGRSCPGPGDAAYTHPAYVQETERPATALMDTFGALVILLSLRTLAGCTELYGAFSPDALLMAPGDLAQPWRSRAFGVLLTSPDERVHLLAYDLMRLCENCENAEIPLASILYEESEWIQAASSASSQPANIQNTSIGNEVAPGQAQFA